VKDAFIQVLMYCNKLGLIGGENFTVDLPACSRQAGRSNVSKGMIGTEKNPVKCDGTFA
jgi:hypothetical protein